MRIWLRVMGAICLLTAAPLMWSILCTTTPLLVPVDLRDMDWNWLALSAAIAFALIALFSLSFAVARNLELSEGIARQLIRLRLQVPGAGQAVVPARTDAGGAQDWLWVMGVLCLLPAPLLGHYIWSESVFANWVEVYIAALSAVGLIAVSGLSFGVARGLSASATPTASLPAPGGAEKSADGGDESSFDWRSVWKRVQYWLRVVAVLCLLPGPLIAYHVFSDPSLYEFYHPRWGWADPVFAGAILFGLVTLSSLSFAEAKALELLHGVAERLPSPGRGSSPAKASPGLYAVGMLCLVLAPILIFEGWTHAREALVGDPLPALTRALALATLSCLSFAVGKGQGVLVRLAAQLPDIQPGRDAGEAVETPLADGVVAALPSQPDSGRTRRRLLLLGPAILALTGAAFLHYHLDPAHAQAHGNRGIALGEVGRYEEALKEFERAAQLDPGAAWAHANRGSALETLGRYEEALAAYDRTTQLAPSEAIGHWGRGHVLGELGRYEEALAAFDRATQLASGEADLHNARGQALNSLGRHGEALAAHDRAIELDPRHASAHYNRGVALDRLGRYEEALAAYGRAVELDSRSVLALWGRGYVLGELGRHEEALAAYDRAIPLDPSLAKVHYNRADALKELGRHEEALAAVDRAIQLDPDHAPSHGRRGRVLWELGRHEDAVAAYDRAIHLSPEAAVVHYNKGFALSELGRYEEAVAAYDRAIQLEPGDAWAHYYRACTYARLGNRHEALRDLRRAIELEGQVRAEAQTDEDLESLRDEPEFRELVGVGEGAG
jgi:tetratricopeptide (TPR) repeat protein